MDSNNTIMSDEDTPSATKRAVGPVSDAVLRRKILAANIAHLAIEYAKSMWSKPANLADPIVLNGQNRGANVQFKQAEEEDKDNSAHIRVRFKRGGNWSYLETMNLYSSDHWDERDAQIEAENLERVSMNLDIVEPTREAKDDIKHPHHADALRRYPEWTDEIIRNSLVCKVTGFNIKLFGVAADLGSITIYAIDLGDLEDNYTVNWNTELLN
ncbi:uncharacterized protein Z519_10993 [Cladophialophora bantiana CBS 173.52]|uniref:Uncharacterized protein n=1 Tax=Cladophialophora bantiana (strain ATCC 10958 / CBS 173.52 / CDC B-1940 / NIH 8579) TaxID=1442370 RepID=A0A0D2HV83_CLAB1|nr:uncharacterized protein Z519_10993 [Cladophialophora bantiana CBS 173.52]KIW88424.1 hypothetical protein Z519_10993 [Cladophialophora bantiana CBS 173.52]